MKFFVCFAVVVVVAGALEVSFEDKAKLKTWSNECKAAQGEERVDQEVLKRAQNGTTADQARVGKHFLCMYKKLGWLDESGDFVLDQIKISMKKVIRNDDQKVDKIVKTCAVKKATPEATAYHLFTCARGQ